METVKRKPFQGVVNIIRFNWHSYLIAFLLVVSLIASLPFVTPMVASIFQVFASSIFLTVGSSILTSYYVYDLSALYKLDWLHLPLPAKPTIINLHAGFDETSVLIAAKYPDAELIILDFYDPKKHTEVSIKRARKAYGAYPGTRSVPTTSLGLGANTVDLFLCILSAHEIRSPDEKANFFRQINLSLKNEGKVTVVEHLRNMPNFLAYNIGFLHFHSKRNWQNVFTSSGFRIILEQKITPFITVFTLQKHGVPS